MLYAVCGTCFNVRQNVMIIDHPGMDVDASLTCKNCFMTNECYALDFQTTAVQAWSSFNLSFESVYSRCSRITQADIRVNLAEIAQLVAWDEASVGSLVAPNDWPVREHDMLCCIKQRVGMLLLLLGDIVGSSDSHNVAPTNSATASVVVLTASNRCCPCGPILCTFGRGFRYQPWWHTCCVSG